MESLDKPQVRLPRKTPPTEVPVTTLPSDTPSHPDETATPDATSVQSMNFITPTAQDNIPLQFEGTQPAQKNPTPESKSHLQLSTAAIGAIAMSIATFLLLFIFAIRMYKRKSKQTRKQPDILPQHYVKRQGPMETEFNIPKQYQELYKKQTGKEIPSYIHQPSLAPVPPPSQHTGTFHHIGQENDDYDRESSYGNNRSSYHSLYSQTAHTAPPTPMYETLNLGSTIRYSDTPTQRTMDILGMSCITRCKSDLSPLAHALNGRHRHGRIISSVELKEGDSVSSDDIGEITKSYYTKSPIVPGKMFSAVRIQDELDGLKPPLQRVTDRHVYTTEMEVVEEVEEGSETHEEKEEFEDTNEKYKKEEEEEEEEKEKEEAKEGEESKENEEAKEGEESKENEAEAKEEEEIKEKKESKEKEEKENVERSVKDIRHIRNQKRSTIVLAELITEKLTQSGIPVRHRYIAKRPNEITVIPNDFIGIIETFDNGMVFGINHTSGCMGVFPLDCVLIQEKEDDLE